MTEYPNSPDVDRGTHSLDTEYLASVAEHVARQAGELLLSRAAQGRIEAAFKNGAEPVTAVDLESDRLIRRELADATPGCPVLSEEAASDDADLWDRLWIVDPIDGTANYLRGHPYVSISVAFAAQGVVEVGVVHAPMLGETFVAVRGGGARCNGRRIVVGSPQSVRSAVVSTGFPHTRTELDPLVHRVRRLLTCCADIRRAASPALDLAWVGAGRLDAHTEDLASWDIAAGSLVAREAGAIRSHLTACPPDTPLDLWGGGIVVSAPSIQAELTALLADPTDTLD